MQTIEKLDLKKRLVMRPYQEIIVNDIVNHFHSGKPYVLGSCPSSGKTEMAIETIIRLMEGGMVNRVLILAHSTNVLKENFYNRLLTYFNDEDVEIMQGQKNYNYNCRIQVMIPQNIKHIKTEFDMIITDEAHHNVLAEDGNYSRIVEMVKPKFQLLLTGTPSKFVRENALDESEPYYINTVGMDMVGLEWFHDVRFDLIKSAYRFNNADYNQYQDLKEDIDFNLEETKRTVNNVIIGAVRNIALRNGIELPKDSDFVSEGRKLIKSGKFGKTLIMCRNIQQANQVADIITNLFKVQVRVSQSQNDTDSKELERFKEGKFNFLCVVKRAREGYDDNQIVNLIDITMTHNIDLIYQMFCRVVRLDEKNPNPKLYIKVTSIAEGMPEYTLNIMTAALMLGATENLRMFNGSNFRNIVMPRVERPDDEPDGDEDEDDVTVDGVVDIVDGTGNVIRRRAISDLMALDLIRIFVKDEENLINGNDRYAMTTLNDSLNKLTGFQDFYDDKEGYFKLFRKEGINSGGLYWMGNYKLFSERDGLKYHSQPWRLFNLTQNEFFDECFDRQDYYNDKEGYFVLCRLNKLTNGHKWGGFYKKLSENDGLKYHSTPWKIFNQDEKSFFDECFNRQGFYEDKKGYFELCLKEGIDNGNFWIDNYKTLSERDGLKYHSQPWRLFGLTNKQFFDECFNKQTVYNDKEGYFVLCRESNIQSNHKWLQKYKALSKKNGLKYHSSPWTLFKQTPKEFFDECFDKQNFYSNKEGYFKLIKIEKITGPVVWVKNYKQFSERDSLKYHSQPWRSFKQRPKEFFEEYREWLKQFDTKTTGRKAYLGEFSEVNKKWNTSNSDATFKRLKKDNSEWKKYHKLYSDARKKWDDIPYVEIVKKIKDRPEWIVGDMGCGENLLKNEIKNKVHSFDFVAIDDTVTACDLSCLPLDNEVLDVAVFSLSLMGTNYSEYVKEAHRVLKPYGMVMIAEPRQRWSDDEGILDEARVKSVLTDAGFRVAGEIRVTDRFIYIDGIK